MIGWAPMKTFAVLLAALPMIASAADSRVFEMRTYYAAPGKDRCAQYALSRSYREAVRETWDHQHRLLDADREPRRTPHLHPRLSKSRRARNFVESVHADPAWTAALVESEKNGKLVVKADHLFMQATDFSPAVQPSSGKGERVFEMRTYTTPPKLLGALDARFRDHTLKLFEKHGMTNLFYFHLLPDAPSSDQTLIYFLAASERPGRGRFVQGLSDRRRLDQSENGFRTKSGRLVDGAGWGEISLPESDGLLADAVAS